MVSVCAMARSSHHLEQGDGMTAASKSAPRGRPHTDGEPAAMTRGAGISIGSPGRKDGATDYIQRHAAAQIL